MPAFGRSTLGGIQGWWNKLDPESRSNGGKRQATWWLKASGGLTVETGGRDTRDEETDREVLSLKEEDCASVKQPFCQTLGYAIMRIVNDDDGETDSGVCKNALLSLLAPSKSNPPPQTRAFDF